jgi:ribonucleoside-diphosphate reductase alpha chain
LEKKIYERFNNSVKLQECKPPSQIVSSLQHFTVVKRNGSIVPFRRERILRAIECAFRDTKKVDKELLLSPSLYQSIDQIVNLVIEDLYKLAVQGTSLTVEGIQDQVEVCLMKTGHHDVARDYIIYRDQHKTLRDDSAQSLKVIREDGIEVRFNPMKIASSLEKAFLQNK